MYTQNSNHTIRLTILQISLSIPNVCDVMDAFWFILSISPKNISSNCMAKKLSPNTTNRSSGLKSKNGSVLFFKIIVSHQNNINYHMNEYFVITNILSDGLCDRYVYLEIFWPERLHFRIMSCSYTNSISYHGEYRSIVELLLKNYESFLKTCSDEHIGKAFPLKNSKTISTLANLLG